MTDELLKSDKDLLKMTDISRTEQSEVVAETSAPKAAVFQAAVTRVIAPRHSRMTRSAPAAGRLRRSRLSPSVVAAVSKLPTSMAGGIFSQGSAARRIFLQAVFSF